MYALKTIVTQVDPFDNDGHPYLVGPSSVAAVRAYPRTPIILTVGIEGFP